MSFCVTNHVVAAVRSVVEDFWDSANGEFMAAVRIKRPILAWFSKHWPSGPMLSISRFVRPSVCTSVCLFTFEVPFNGLFAPTSRSRMSNIFTDSESLGKSNGTKWSQIWTFLFENCLKSPRKKSFFSALFLVFFGFRSFLTVFLPPLPEVGCPIFLEIRNPWGKVMKRSGLRYEHFCLKIA